MSGIFLRVFAAEMHESWRHDDFQSGQAIGLESLLVGLPILTLSFRFIPKRFSHRKAMLRKSLWPVFKIFLANGPTDFVISKSERKTFLF